MFIFNNMEDIKSTGGEQTVGERNIPILTSLSIDKGSLSIFVCVCLLPTPDQTKNNTDLNLGAHSPDKYFYLKIFLKSFRKSKAAVPELYRSVREKLSELIAGVVN